MKPTLEIDQRVLVDRASYRFGDPDVGDVVVFHPPQGPKCAVSTKDEQPCPEAFAEESETNFIKRIVAGPEDRIRIEDGHPVVNGELMDDEEYIRPCGSGDACDLTEEITVPPGHYFMMGDNRAVGASDDSRFWGPVPREWIIGKAFFTYWPIKRVGLL